MLSPLPRRSGWATLRSASPNRISLPRKGCRVGLHIVLFEDCSAFTRVAARTLAPSPKRDLLHRRLQPYRYLHDCSGCFRLERLTGGSCTHWKTPPFHGAHPERSSLCQTCRVGKARTCPRVPTATVRVGTARGERAFAHPTLAICQPRFGSQYNSRQGGRKS